MSGVDIYKAFGAIDAELIGEAYPLKTGPWEGEEGFSEAPEKAGPSEKSFPKRRRAYVYKVAGIAAGLAVVLAVGSFAQSFFRSGKSAPQANEAAPIGTEKSAELREEESGSEAPFYFSERSLGQDKSEDDIKPAVGRESESLKSYDGNAEDAGEEEKPQVEFEGVTYFLEEDASGLEAEEGIIGEAMGFSVRRVKGYEESEGIALEKEDGMAFYFAKGSRK